MNTSPSWSQENTAGQSARVRFGLGIVLSILRGVLLLLSLPPYGLRKSGLRKLAKIKCQNDYVLKSKEKK
jgi:hypothetical protein